MSLPGGSSSLRSAPACRIIVKTGIRTGRAFDFLQACISKRSPRETSEGTPWEATSVPGDESAVHTFLFADMAGFTALTEEMGDEEAVEVAERFFAGAREVLADHGATEVKTIGDALMIECGDAAHAIQLGVRLAGEIGVRHRYPSVRVGMHTGPAVRRGEDWFGATVNLAARVSGAAAGGEVLLTDATRSAAGPVSGVELIEHGRHELRNVGDPVSLFRAVPVGTGREVDELPIDPVCRMAVDPDDAAGTLRHEGRTFHFCSMKCVRAFSKDPERYLGA